MKLNFKGSQTAGKVTLKRYLLILFVLLIFNSCNSNGQNCSICGNWKWEKNDDKRDFTLQVMKLDSIIVGKHCYIVDSGNKMDCSAQDNDYSFKSAIPNSDSLTVKIRSFYSNEVGIVSIKYYKGKIYWKLLQLPKGEFYLPREAILIKNN